MTPAQEFLRVADLLPEGALLLDTSGRIVAANAKIARILGRPAAALRDAHLCDLCRETPEQLQQYLHRCAGTRAMVMGALHLHAAGGSTLAFRCEGAVYQPRTAQAPALVFLRILPKAAATRQFAALTLRVAELAREVKRRRQAEQELARHDRSKDEFLAILAHELRNPMAPLRTSLHLMELAEDRPEIQVEARGIMRRQIEHMVRLIDDLLDLSRISSGKIELRRERVDLHTVVRNAVETSRPLIEARGHELQEELAAGSVTINGDLTRLTQVVANLLNNSAKYTEPGGRITIRARVEGEEAVISVRDNGVGISPEMLPQLFVMFSQMGRAPNTIHGGLGVGLSLVKRLTEMHGGRVAAHSEGQGRGSEFSVRLPIMERGISDGEVPAVQDGAATGASRRIIVVDDNVDSAHSLGMLLRLLGHDIRTAHDGPQALALGEALRPDIVILDIGMPGMDGYETARRIRASDWGRNIVLVALTGWGQAADKREAVAAGFDHHLVKPVEMAKLQALFTNVTLPVAAEASSTPSRRLRSVN